MDCTRKRIRNANGVVDGTIVSYGSGPFVLTGNSNVTINKANCPQMPAGFSYTGKLSPDAGTYVEN